MVAPAELGRRFDALRLREPAAVRAVRGSLVRHGQLTAATVFREADGHLELVDGFKRLHAGHELGWPQLRVRVLRVDEIQAKAAVAALNRAQGLTELEEAWLVRSLYRDDGLTQPQIGLLLERHKSWVCRRLMLVEQLDAAVQADVRLGLLSARTAAAIARLPRDNQGLVAELVTRRGLTTLQTDRLVTALLAAPDAARRRRILTEWESGRAGPTAPRGREAARAPDSPVCAIMGDVGLLCRVAGRLQSRLLERPLDTLGVEAANSVRNGLVGLCPVLDRLRETLEHAAGPKETP